MIKDQMQNATITINPPHLGQIEVKLQTDQAQQTSVQFMSNNPEVRQAITDHLGTLREMMSHSGLQLGQADVGARNQSSSEQYGSSASKKGNSKDFSLPEITSTESSQGIGLINTYA
jgi:flagellar hook-length control protein FliK